MGKKKLVNLTVKTWKELITCYRWSLFRNSHLAVYHKNMLLFPLDELPDRLDKAQKLIEYYGSLTVAGQAGSVR